MFHSSQSNWKTTHRTVARHWLFVTVQITPCKKSAPAVKNHILKLEILMHFCLGSSGVQVTQIGIVSCFQEFVGKLGPQAAILLSALCCSAVWLK